MIAFILTAHGSLADELLKSAELIGGEQANVAAIKFFPGEDQSHLIAKYTEALQSMEKDDGVLFLCDLFGGSPFNAASRLATGMENWDAVTGVNLPMLLELYGLRTSHSVGQLAAAAKEIGAMSIQSLKSLKPLEEEEL